MIGGGVGKPRRKNIKMAYILLLRWWHQSLLQFLESCYNYLPLSQLPQDKNNSNV